MKSHSISYYKLEHVAENEGWKTVAYIDGRLPRSEAEHIVDELTNGKFKTYSDFHILTGPHQMKILGK